MVSVLHGVADPLTWTRSLRRLQLRGRFKWCGVVVSIWSRLPRAADCARSADAVAFGAAFAVSDNGDPRKPDPADCRNTVGPFEIGSEWERASLAVITFLSFRAVYSRYVTSRENVLTPGAPYNRRRLIYSVAIDNLTTPGYVIADRHRWL